MHKPIFRSGNTASENNPQRFFQPKLAINQPNDVYEQEADAIADKVMRMPNTNNTVNFFFNPSIDSIQRKCAHCEEEEKLQRKETGNEQTAVSETTANYISSLNGKGRSLTTTERSFFEPKFGYDFSNVKIHNDTEAAQSAQSINALAYTTGNNIVFNQNQFSPETGGGKKLLAHELTHVVQQSNGNTRSIQKADIDHRTLTWDDFKGAPPDKANFDAETFSNINYPDLTTIKPLITEKELAEDCDTKDSPAQKAKKVEATVGLDSGGIKVSAFMSQEKSWVKSLFKNEDAMKKFCKTDSNTLSQIKGCKDYFSTGKTNAATACKPLLDDCKKNVKNGYTWKNIEATDESGCNTIYEACKKEQTDALKYTTGKNKNITSADDCSSVLQDECLEIRKEAAAGLLSHEQGHFDITDLIARNLQSDIKMLVDSYAKKTVTGCGHTEAQNLATAVVEKDVKPKINDKVKEAQDKINAVKGYTDADKNKIPGTLRTTQDTYDTETTHGTVTEQQKKWKDNIAKGKI